MLDALLDPLSLFGLLLLCVVVFQWRACRAPARAGGLLLIAVLLVFSAPALVNPVVAAYEARLPGGDACEADTGLPVVLLGGGLDGRASAADQIGYLHSASYRRTVKAAELALQAPSATVYVAGGAYRQVAEADVMSALLLRLGVAQEQMRLDSRSMNTFENAQQVRELMTAAGEADRIRLVTSAIHMPRAAAVFEASGLDVCPVPLDYLGLHHVPMMALLPQSTALRKTAALLHEWIGWAYYRLSGKL
ncbi:YdcF family protein [Granulosicoccaceae sp. 1_MG-2023]|nr:YdcF family protein [Granulosicoccaceae sp. 1_MG-2023]